MLSRIASLQFTQALSYFALTRNHEELVTEKSGQHCLDIFYNQACFPTTSDHFFAPWRPLLELDSAG